MSDRTCNNCYRLENCCRTWPHTVCERHQTWREYVRDGLAKSAVTEWEWLCSELIWHTTIHPMSAMVRRNAKQIRLGDGTPEVNQ